MNKKIIFLAFAIFAVSIEQMNACEGYDSVMEDTVWNIKQRLQRNPITSIGSFGIEEIVRTIQEIKSMNRTDSRDSRGLSVLSSRGPCTPGYAYRADAKDCLKDVLRNQPEFGGPSNALELVREDYLRTVGTPSLYKDHNSCLCQMMNSYYLLTTYTLK